MARLGFRRLDDMVGRVDMLRMHADAGNAKARMLDLRAILHEPSARGVARRQVRAQEHGLERALDIELLRLAAPALERGENVSASLPIRNVHRTVGAMLSGEIARRHGQQGLPDGTIELAFTGSAGQSFGAFAVSGLTLRLEGEANDYVGKGLSGGRIVVYPPRGSRFPAADTILVGNTVLYGATSGEAFFRGAAGERFAVRNSGATAVVEGVGDHGCEYMTGGTVIVLGRTGRNFAAGMSGGTAFVLDVEGDFATRCNAALVELGPVDDDDDLELLARLIERHARLTGSSRARDLLEGWETQIPPFVRVMPAEFHRAMREQRLRHALVVEPTGRDEIPRQRMAG
jgi:glutamate synthase (NADPH) large chain